MRLILLSFTTFLFCSFCHADTFSPAASYSICFTPAEKCARQIINAINQAKNTVAVQAYSFTSTPIAKALIRAQKRHVEVMVIIDQSQLINYSKVWRLLKTPIPIWLDNTVRIAHNKVIIIDKQIVVTGSYNFTNAAEYKNAENLLVINDTALANRYWKNWLSRKNQSVRLSLALAKKLQRQLQQTSNER
jgi:phosphatidylserine/phosphatidylglycerophosphate/cardiolipin synthase-like enzyme